MGNQPEIFFHVGLGKVASTYLQHRVFPKLKGIQYIPTNRYKKSKRIIQGNPTGKYLVSREFDRQLEREVAWFTETYPQSKVIIIFRRHDSWIASQYRRYVKNGWHWDFSKFLDLANDSGFWKREQLLFYPMLQVIEKYTGSKPLVLFHDELKAEPEAFVKKISDYCGATISFKEISTASVHKSYSEKQLLVLRAFCRKFKKVPPRAYHNKLIHWLLYRPWWGFFHLIMYVASVIPKGWVPKGPLVPVQTLLEIRATFEEDWQRVVDYSIRNND